MKIIIILTMIYLDLLTIGTGLYMTVDGDKERLRNIYPIHLQSGQTIILDNNTGKILNGSNLTKKKNIYEKITGICVMGLGIYMLDKHSQ